MRARRTIELSRQQQSRLSKVGRAGGGLRFTDESTVRLWCIGVFFTCILCALWWRAFDLQIIMGDNLAKRASRQHLAQETLVGMRGSILDRHGNILARSVDSHSVWVNPKLISSQAETVNILASILGVNKAKLKELVQQDKKFVWIARKINDSLARQIKEADLAGVFLSAEYDRVYPYKTLAGQLLGFVSVDDKGIEGLEKGLDEVLSASTHKQLIQRDAAGRRLGLAETESIDSLRGRDVYLTIDSQVQFFAEEALAEGVSEYGAKWGGCIVIDAQTGEILAWAQYPFFDPNNPTKYPEEIRRNRIAADALEQGSTIKSFLVAAALEEGVVTPETEIFAENGQWKVGRFVIHDDTHSYGVLPVKKILHVSSNIGMGKIGLKLGSKKYDEYLRKLGFGSILDLPLAGQSKGILRAADKWKEIDIVTASFGQGFSASLAQIGQAYLRLVNGSERMPLSLTMTPGEGSRQAEQKRLFSKKTVSQVSSMLRDVVGEDGGTARRARIAGIEVGGKTGTAQKVDKTGKYGRGRVGSFTGIVPIDNPRYIICVLLDEPTKSQYGGRIAAPIFRDVAIKLIAYHNLLPDSDDPLIQELARKEQKNQRLSLENSSSLLHTTQEREEKASKSSQKNVKGKQIPNVIGYDPASALQAFAAQGIIPVFQGKGSVVVEQIPAADSPLVDEQTQYILVLKEKL